MCHRETVQAVRIRAWRKAEHSTALLVASFRLTQLSCSRPRPVNSSPPVHPWACWNEAWSGALMEDCYFEAAESDSNINQHKAGLKSNGCIRCTYTGEFTPFRYSDLMIWEAAFIYFKHFHEHNEVRVTHIMAHLISKSKSCSYKLSKENESGVLDHQWS